MKRGTKLAIMSLLLLLAIVAAIAVAKLTEEEEVTEDTSETVLSLDGDSVTSISWEYGGNSVSLGAAEGEWYYTDDTDFPLDTTYVTDILSALSDLKSEKTISEPSELSDYGLDEPEYTVNIESDEKDVTILIGNLSASEEQRYVSLGDGRVYMIDVAFADNFSYGLYDLIEKDTVPDMSDLYELDITADGDTLALKYAEDGGISYSDDYKWYSEDNGDSTVLDTDNTEAVVDAVTGLSLGDCVSYKASAVLSEFGLDEPALTVTAKYGDSETVIYIGEAGDEYYIRLDTSELIYKDTSLYSVLSEADVSSLLPDEVISLPLDDVTGVTVTLADDSYEFVKTTETEIGDDTVSSVDKWTLDGTEVSFTDIWDGLEAITGYNTDLPDELGDSELSFTVSRSNEEYPTVTVEFYETDGVYTAVLNDSYAVVISASDVDTLESTVNSVISGDNDGE